MTKGAKVGLVGDLKVRVFQVAAKCKRYIYRETEKGETEKERERREFFRSRKL